MTEYRRSFRCEVITPAGVVLETEAVSVVFPGADGEIGVLANRAPLAGLVGAGRLEIVEADRRRREYFVEGGFAHVGENRVTLLVQECLAPEEIDREAAYDRVRQVSRLPADTPEAAARRADAASAARARFHLAQKHWRLRRRPVTLPEDD